MYEIEKYEEQSQQIHSHSHTQTHRPSNNDWLMHQ